MTVGRAASGPTPLTLVLDGEDALGASAPVNDAIGSASGLSRRTKTLLLVITLVVAAGLAWLVYRRMSDGSEERGGGRPAEVTVTVAPARAITLTRSIEGVGDILATDAVVVTSEAAGRVSEIRFREGEEVPEGAVLVTLDAAQEDAEVATRQAEAAELRGRLQRLQRLVGEGAVSRGSVTDLRRTLQAAEARTAAARTVAEDTVIRAPFPGTLGLRQVSVGAFVQPGAELVTLDRIDTVKLRFTIPENALGRVRVGSPIEVRSPAFGDQVFRGRVAAFAGRLDPSLRTLTAEARLPNLQRLLRPGMLADVTVSTETVPAVVIPPVALQVRGPTHFVYEILQGCAVRREVQVGQREPDGVEVLRGLAPGAVVAADGFDALSSGTPVIDKRQAQQRARRGDPKAAGKAKGEKGKAKSEEDVEREAALKRRCQQVAARAGGPNG